MIKLFACKELTVSAIIMEVDLNWSQDDLPNIIEHYFQQYTLFDKIEWSKGADLESVRFKWQQHDFSINFECYSQSVWLECPEHNGAELLTALFQEMSTVND